MKKQWLRLINLGIDQTTDENEIMYIQVCNGLSILVSLWMLSLVPLVIPYWPDSRVLIINGIVFPMLWPLILWFNSKKKYMLARIYLTVTSMAIITINVLTVGGDTANHLFIVMYIASGLVVYPKMKHFILVAAAGFIHFMLLELWFQSHGPLIPADPEYLKLVRTLSITNIPVLFIIIAIYHKNLLLKAKKNLREQKQAYQNLLDHAGQGFLTFDQQLLVQGEYSAECKRLFQREIDGLRIDELLMPDNRSEQRTLIELMTSLFEGDDLHRKVCMSLLPAESDLGGKQLSFEYQWIWDLKTSSPVIMIVITDISEKRQLELRMVEEQERMHMIIHVIKYFDDFKELIRDYRSFAQEGRLEILQSSHTFMDKWSALSLNVHTFKGNFAQYHFKYLTAHLHDLETQMTERKTRMIHRTSDKDTEALLKWFGDLDLLGWLKKDLEIVGDYLGERFSVNHDYMMIDRNRLQQLEQRIRSSFHGHQAKALLHEIRILQYRDLKDLLGVYSAYVMKLARQTNKEVYPLTIHGGEMLVDPKKYAHFIRALTHVFRNMVDHGIETPDERAAKGKDIRGRVECRIYEEDDAIQLMIANDGKPIDANEIKARVIEQGICTAEQFDGMTEEEQMMLIVRESISTRSSVSQLSGRGFGLSAVYEALRALKGTMRVQSSEKTGTVFIFSLPHADH